MFIEELTWYLVTIRLKYCLHRHEACKFECGISIELSETGLLNEKDVDGFISIQGPNGQLSLEKFMSATSFTKDLMQRWINGGQVLAVFMDLVPPQEHSPITGLSSADSTKPDVHENGAAGNDYEKPPTGHDLEVEPNRQIDVDDCAWYSWIGHPDRRDQLGNAGGCIPPDHPSRDTMCTGAVRVMGGMASVMTSCTGISMMAGTQYDDDYNIRPVVGFHKVWSSAMTACVSFHLFSPHVCFEWAFMECLHDYGVLGGPTGWSSTVTNTNTPIADIAQGLDHLEVAGISKAAPSLSLSECSRSSDDQHRRWTYHSRT